MIKSLRCLLSTILQYIVTFYEYCQQLIQKRFTGKLITFDTGRRVILGKQIAEGGFSYIFVAYDASTTTRKNHRGATSQQQSYALKRIYCPDSELIDRCRYEADVHRHVVKRNDPNGVVAAAANSCQHYVMPLYGFTIIQHDCYMLFPLCTESLRGMVNRTNPFLQQQLPLPPSQQIGDNNNRHRTISSTTTATPPPPPISKLMVLQLFRQIVLGVQALHNCGYTHRDIKIENVMIVPSSSPRRQQTSRTATTTTEVVPHLLIMDFGSAGPTEVIIHSRKQLLEIIEQAAQHTTMPYRPPELFDGGIRILNNNSNAVVLDYCAVDVWSLGCTLHAIMYGASPFECEFVIDSTARGSSNSTSTTSGTIKIVDCTHLSILGNIPIPKYMPMSVWYNNNNSETNSIRNELLLPMLQPEPQKRPKLSTVLQIVERMIEQMGGTIIDMPSIDIDNSNNYESDQQYRHHHYRDDINKNDDENDGIALLSRVI